MAEDYFKHLKADAEDILQLENEGLIKKVRDAYEASSLPILLPVTASEERETRGLGIEAPNSRNSRSTLKDKPGKRKSSTDTQIVAKRRKIAEEVTEGQVSVLSLFGSCDASSYGPVRSNAKGLTDVLLFCGGPVQALDWCPAAPDSRGNEANLQYLAVAAHPKDKKNNPMGCPVTGQGIIQIWEIAHEPGFRMAAPLPRVVYAICHDHGVVWDLKWCPVPAGQYSKDSRLGILAVLFGDGEIALYAIPKAEDDSATSNTIVLDLSLKTERPEAEFIRMKPQASLPANDAPSLGSCLEWLPSPPHDLLLVGCWDGSVLILRIPPADAKDDNLQVLTHIMADSTAIRSVCWAPVEIAENISDKSERHFFVTAGHSSTIKIWDSRDPFQPLMEASTSISWIMKVVWMHNPTGIMFFQDDSSVKFLELTTFHRASSDQKEKQQISWLGAVRGTIWSCHMSPISGHTAYAGDSGQVVIAFPGFQHKSRNPRPPHIIVSGTKQEDGIIKMSTQQPPIQMSGVKATPKKGDFSDPRNAVISVRWGNAKAADPQGTWLASGARNGIVRCQRLSFYVTF